MARRPKPLRGSRFPRTGRTMFKRPVSMSYNSVAGGMRTGEKKTIDRTVNSFPADTTGTVNLLNGVATGTDFTERIGRKILIKSIYIQGIVQTLDTVSNNCLNRLIVVLDKQPNGAAPAINDVLVSSNSTEQLNLNNRDRFRILADKRFATAQIDTTATQAFAGSPTCHVVKIYKKCNITTQYSGTTNGIGSLATNAIHMITVGNQVPGSGGNFILSARVRFVDA